MPLGLATLFARIDAPRSVISVCSASTSSEVMLVTSRQRQRGCRHYSTIAFVIAPAALCLRHQRFFSAGRTRQTFAFGYGVSWRWWIIPRTNISRNSRRTEGHCHSDKSHIDRLDFPTKNEPRPLRSWLLLLFPMGNQCHDLQAVRQCRRHVMRCVHRDRADPMAGTGRKATSDGMAVAGFGSQEDGGGRSGPLPANRCRRYLRYCGTCPVHRGRARLWTSAVRLMRLVRRVRHPSLRRLASLWSG
jgi:hypothetical protein